MCIRDSAGTVLVNEVTVNADTPDPDPSDNFDNETTSVEACADMGITIDDHVDPATAGLELTYTVNVTNDGPSDAENVVVVVVLPAEVTFVGTTAPAAMVCQENNNVVRCNIAEVNSTQVVEFLIFTTVVDPSVLSGTVITAFANVTSDCLLYTSPSPRDQRGSRMPSSA